MFTITMFLERSTKGTHVYQSTHPADRIRTLYITKSFVNGREETPPTSIIVTVAATPDNS